MIPWPFERVPPARLPERMDDPDADPEALEESLEALAWTNRRLGGRRLVASPLLSLLACRDPGPLALLDVGAGGGDIAADLSGGLVARGWRPRVVLGDLRVPILRSARRRVRREAPESAAFRFVRLSGASLPFDDGSFDLAWSATTLHHLAREEAVQLVAELGRVSRAGWVVTDLRRSRTAWLALQLVARTLWRKKRYARRDGPVSIRRSFTRGELERIVEEAGVGPARVERAEPFRLRVLGGELAEG